MPKIIGLLEAGNADGKLVNAKNVYDEQQGQSQEEINATLMASLIGGGSGLLPPMSLTEYNALETKENTLYFITDREGLRRIYYGETLIAKRASTGATNIGFPLVFPIIFN